MLGYISTSDSKISSIGLHRINYLIGEFNVLVYLYKADLWIKIGSGVSSISSSDKLVSEKIEIINGDELISMNNTFGHESSDDYKMLALDLTSGTMDVYKGKILDEKLIFSNSDFGSNSKSIQGIDYSFKLIYNQLSQEENQVVIGRSKDDGKTWIPYLKSIYRRK